MQHTEVTKRKPRSEIVRILMCMGITIGVQVLILLCGVLLLPFTLGAGLERLDEELAHLFTAVFLTYLAYWMIGPAIAAALNQRFTFRAKGRWWVSPLIMAGLGLLFGFAGAFLLDAVLKLEPAGVTGVVLTALWLIVQYLVQRFVLFGKTLDTL